MSGTRSIELATDAVDRVARLLQQRIGLRPEASLRGRLRRCIRDDAAARGLTGEAYVDALASDEPVLQSLLNRVTVQETSFFRHPEHFAVLVREVLPTLSGPVRIWSAGCANGQEPFSLAMVLEEQGVEGSVVATDLSTAALRRVTAGHYSGRELAGLHTDRLARHFTPDGDGWRVNAAIRDRVQTRQHNLLDPFPPEIASSQVIFCRNVLIYFTSAHAQGFFDQVVDALPDAVLFLGAAETIWPLTNQYNAVHLDGAFIYRRRANRPSPNPTRAAKPLSPASRPTAQPARRLAPAPRMPSTPAPSETISIPTAPEHGSDAVLAAELSGAGQRASAAGDVQSAVVAFRKCAYLVPDDPMAHLHLGLALETAGDRSSARRAYAAARRALAGTDPSDLDQAIEGYTVSDLIRLLDAKEAMVTTP